MADLNSRERRKLELLLDMGSGYVLNFSNPTFAEFFSEFVGKDIDNPRYEAKGTSKANRLRSFWALEPNHLVAKSLTELIAHGVDARLLRDRHLIQECQAIIDRLATDKPVADIDAISAEDNPDFELVARAVRESIDTNQPETGLDRLHTFVVKFVRQLCKAHGLAHDRGTPLNSLFGSYVKHMAREGHFASDMTERILKSSIANLEAFNHVRNHHTLAHDNPVLSYDESLLIFNHVVSAVRFVKAFEEGLNVRAATKPATEPDSEIPF